MTRKTITKASRINAWHFQWQRPEAPSSSTHHVAKTCVAVACAGQSIYSHCGMLIRSQCRPVPPLTVLQRLAWQRHVQARPSTARVAVAYVGQFLHSPCGSILCRPVLPLTVWQRGVAVASKSQSPNTLRGRGLNGSSLCRPVPQLTKWQRLAWQQHVHASPNTHHMATVCLAMAYAGQSFHSPYGGGLRGSGLCRPEGTDRLITPPPPG